jgi:Holliday junction resolvase RusA-like endonuclease
MSEHIIFTVLGKPEPQGSMKAFVIKGKARLTSANTKMKSWRQEVGWAALDAWRDGEPFAAKHVPVKVDYLFVINPPPSKPKRRLAPAVKPDIDKLIRACTDALTGILYVDDGQVVECHARKIYGQPERTEITVEIV